MAYPEGGVRPFPGWNYGSESRDFGDHPLRELRGAREGGVVLGGSKSGRGVFSRV